MALTCPWRSRPQHHFRTHASQQIATLFERLVGATLQLSRKRGESRNELAEQEIFARRRNRMERFSGPESRLSDLSAALVYSFDEASNALPALLLP